MSWKLIFGLSLLGAAMGVATVFVVPSDVEPWCWAAVFAVCAWSIAKRAPSKYFVHGLCLGLVNSVWVTGAHVALYDTYVARHAREAAMLAQLQMASPKVAMLVTGPVVGLVSGVVIGLMAWVTSKFVVSAHSEYAGW
jgi:small basic protein